MSLAPLTSPSDPQTGQLKLTVEQYHAMIAQGILKEGEPFELIDGHVTRKDRSAAGEDRTTVGTKHALAVKLLSRLADKLDRVTCHLQTQQPLELADDQEPEPDGAVIDGAPTDYRDHHPRGDDVHCVIEVPMPPCAMIERSNSASTPTQGIGQSIIVNLPERCIEVYTSPRPGTGRYGQSQTLGANEMVSIAVAGGKQVEITVAELLP